MNMSINLRRRGSATARLLAAASLGVLAVTALAPPAWAQETPGADVPPDTNAAIPPDGGAGDPGAEESTAQEAIEETQAEDVVVTGFRRSLAQALNVKRQSVSSVDAIVAEDIAKFPDQNLAESLQRIPGISIQRDAGEGRAITVRGLGAQFTRVRVNGLETVATSTDGASANRDRAFDFNVFASELFSSIVVHKTAEASLDEGSLGAVVDLNTGNPLAGRTGFTMVASAQASYNTLSEDLGPRLAGLVSWKSPDGDFGVSLSAAYQQNRTLELGNNTVRWQQARFDSVNGQACFTRPNVGGTYVPSPDCDAVATAFHPRIPRYGEISHDRERLGLTASAQWSPTDATKVSIDGLYSRFNADRSEKYAEVLFRGNERRIDVVDFQIDPATNDIVKGTFNDAWVRTENYFRESQTEFYQLGASWDQDVTDRFRFTLLGGFSKSDASIPLESTLVFDDRDAQNYQYDYTDSRRPVLTFGTSVTDPSEFQLSEIRDRPSETVNKFRTLNLRTEYDIGEDFQVKLGGVYRRFNFDTEGFTRDTIICPNRTTAGPDVVLGTITCTPQSGANAVFGPNAVYGYPVTDSIAELFNLRRAGAPQGTTTEWLIPNLKNAAEFTGLYDRPLGTDAGNTRAVQEEVTGGYLQFDFKGDVLGLRYAANAGVRYVNTDQESTGLSNGQIVTIERSYEDWLPAMNVAFFPTEDIVVRFAASDVLTRPSLGNLTPGGSVDGFNYRVSFGNPLLQPFRATAYDTAFEWYFAPQSIFSVALFKKEVESFPISSTQSGTYASTGLPLSLIPPSSPAASNPEGQLWTINTIINGTGASLKGAEISLQAPFRFLPGILSNFGGIANATFVDSDATYTVSGPAVVPGGPLVAETRTATLFGLSKRAYNGTLYYEDTKFSARVSASYRSGFLDATSGTGNVFEGYNSTINIDASMRYRLTEALEFSLEGINLTDEYRDRFTDVDANRNYEYNHFGRTILAGVRYKM